MYKRLMRVLVACEYSGRVRDAFLSRGHDAWSCDVRPAAGRHIQGDVRNYLADGWDFMVGHPPCTYLCRSGYRWFQRSKLRYVYFNEAVRFFYDLWNADIPSICLENPIPHTLARRHLPDYHQVIQPWMFGDAVSKRMCLWLKDCCRMEPDYVVPGSMSAFQRIPKAERSVTFPGVARAISEQLPGGSLWKSVGL